MKTPEEIKDQIGILFNMLDMRDKMQIAVQLNVTATGHLLGAVPKFSKEAGTEIIEVGVNLDHKPDKRIDELRKDWGDV